MYKLIAALVVLALIAPLANADIAPPRKVGIGEPGEPWWDESTASWLGGTVGGAVGLAGAAYGVIAGLGIARRFMVILTVVLALDGAVVLIVGLIAVATGQPFHVYLLPLIVGGVLTLICGINYPILKRRRDEFESQQMRATDS
ncbi:MAG: hypothetical protein HY289_13980 [Planctomycetes bacterium]|nr:hypothetical protein [Planctomycetota bacterium]